MRLVVTPLSHRNQSNIHLHNTRDMIQTGKPLHVKARRFPLLGEISAIFITAAQREFKLAVCRKLGTAEEPPSWLKVHRWAPSGCFWRNTLEMELLVAQASHVAHGPMWEVEGGKLGGNQRTAFIYVHAYQLQRANTGFAIGMSALKTAKGNYFHDKCPYAAPQGRLWPPSIKCLFLGMLLSCGHQSYLREGKKGFVSPLTLLTRCDIKYQHISTGERNRAWLIMACSRIY